MSAPDLDVLIVGAGLSGIGAACHLQDDCPGKRYAILEGRDSMGGTWDLFRFPGIRSDSDMYTLGYDFKPWRNAKAIADGASILAYIRETAEENGIEDHIRYGHLVKRAEWSSEDATWTVTAERRETGETISLCCNFLLMCAGYYSYERGHTPEFKGRDRFAGQIVHPQEWPEDLDHRDRKVVVIGSGATAATLVPQVARDAETVVMLQRSPSYYVSRPDTDRIANLLRKFLPESIAYALARWKNAGLQEYFYNRTRKAPEKVKRKLLQMVRKELGADYDIETHFTPRYDPWDQRLCLVPNSDLFNAIRSGKVSVVTDRIDTFTERGLLLESGTELEADIVVTATGLELVILGGTEFVVDGQRVDFSRTYTYKGMMYSGVPNMVSTFGYVNASWTLRADLTARYVCRLLNHMDTIGRLQCTPCLREEDRNMQARPWIEGFSSGYVQRVMHLFPKQGDREPWINPQRYSRDKKMIGHGAIDDGALVFSHPAHAAVPAVDWQTGSVEPAPPTPLPHATRRNT